MSISVHRCRSGQVLVRLLVLARAPVELAKAEMAVSDEGAHAARGRERQRLAVGAVLIQSSRYADLNCPHFALSFTSSYGAENA